MNLLSLRLEVLKLTGFMIHIRLAQRRSLFQFRFAGMGQIGWLTTLESVDHRRKVLGDISLKFDLNNLGISVIRIVVPIPFIT